MPDEINDKMIEVEESRLRMLIQQNQQLQQSEDNARQCLKKVLAVYNQLEKDGIIDILQSLIKKDNVNVMSLLSPIGRIIPKLKKYGDNEAINDVFNIEFFETAKKAAQ